MTGAWRDGDTRSAVAKREPEPEPKSGFPNDEGKFRKFDFVVRGGKKRKVPKELDCESSFTIYSAAGDFLNQGGPPECNRFTARRANPSAKAKKLLDTARERAEEVAKKIDCPKDCPDRVIEEVWRGWDCRRDDRLGWDLGIVAVELEVSCRPRP